MMDTNSGTGGRSLKKGAKKGTSTAKQRMDDTEVDFDLTRTGKSKNVSFAEGAQGNRGGKLSASKVKGKLQEFS